MPEAALTWVVAMTGTMALIVALIAISREWFPPRRHQWKAQRIEHLLRIVEEHAPVRRRS